MHFFTSGGKLEGVFCKSNFLNGSSFSVDPYRIVESGHGTNDLEQTPEYEVSGAPVCHASMTPNGL